MFEDIRLETLKVLFSGHQIGEKLKFKKSTCVECGRPIGIEIQKTSAGYGFLKGILYEPHGLRLLVQCSACYGKK